MKYLFLIIAVLTEIYVLGLLIEYAYGLNY